MYKIKNGILNKDGKKLFALGESYYPSFHPCKFPVSPDGDRIGEMKKDVKMMEEAGFNHIRIAALGEVSYDKEADRCSIDSPLVDAILSEAEKNGMSVSVRLQGFSVNLRGFTDCDMIDEKGRVPDYAWCDFVRTSPSHEGILEDNRVFARDLASRYAEFPSVVGFQIYNEPKFPRPALAFCDYSSHSVEAFRKYLVSQGLMSEGEAADYQPPRSPSEGAREWAVWRKFSNDSLSAFLNNASDGAKMGSSLPTFTCFVPVATSKYNSRCCVDPFANAKSMDIVGYTIYKHAWGSEYYPMCLEGDTFQSAADGQGKCAWCVELDSRTYIPPFVYTRGTYATVGSGVKGIVYYQWRGDCPVEGVPFPNSCGILNYDGTKTENFDNAVATNRFIASVNDLLIESTRPHEGIGLLHSLYADFYCAALENSAEANANGEYFNSSTDSYCRIYTDLRRAGYTVTVVEWDSLENSALGLKVLIVPDFTHLSEREKEAVDRFYKNGGEVFISRVADPGAYSTLKRYGVEPKSRREEVFAPPVTPFDIEGLTGIKPICRSFDPLIGVQTLVGDGYTLLVLTDLSVEERETDAELYLNIPFRSAEFTSVDGDRSVEISGNKLTVKGIKNGGIIIVR